MVKKASKKEAPAQRVIYMAEVGKGGKPGKVKAYVLAGVQTVPKKEAKKRKRRRE